ncbi:MAG: 5-oxoprolinase, partial [Actinomycetales bacterium]
SVQLTQTDDLQAAIADEFTKRHRKQYGHVMEDPLELTTLRVTAIGLVDKPDIPKLAVRQSGESYPKRSRIITLPGGKEVEYALLAREDLLAGDQIAGPAVITEYTATTVLHPGDQLVVGDYGELIIKVHSDKADAEVKED